MRERGYSFGNAAGYTNGETAGHESGVKAGIDEASDELDCSDDSHADLPACDNPEYNEDDPGDPTTTMMTRTTTVSLKNAPAWMDRTAYPGSPSDLAQASHAFDGIGRDSE